MLMKRSNLWQLGLAAVFFLLAVTLPVPFWLYALTLGLALGCGLLGACGVCKVFDDDKMFSLSQLRLERMRGMHRRGDG